MPDQTHDQLDFWASLNGQDPVTFARTQRDIEARNNAAALQQRVVNAQRYYDQVGTSSPESGEAYDALQAAKAALASSQGQSNYTPYWDLAQDQAAQASADAARLDPYTQAINAQSGANDADRSAWAQGGATAWQQQTAGNAALFQGLESGRSAADARDAAALGRYGGALDTANSVSAQGLSNLQSRYDDYGILQASPYVGDAQSNPEDVARQMQSYETLDGWASGANNISSDPQFVGMQMDSYNQLGGWASGANDVSSDAGLVGQQQDVYGGFMDYASGANAISSGRRPSGYAAGCLPRLRAVRVRGHGPGVAGSACAS